MVNPLGVGERRGVTMTDSESESDRLSGLTDGQTNRDSGSKQRDYRNKRINQAAQEREKDGDLDPIVLEIIAHIDVSVL